jgi:hypothetical protein
LLGSLLFLLPLAALFRRYCHSFHYPFHIPVFSTLSTAKMKFAVVSAALALATLVSAMPTTPNAGLEARKPKSGEFAEFFSNYHI